MSSAAQPLFVTRRAAPPLPDHLDRTLRLLHDLADQKTGRVASISWRVLATERGRSLRTLYRHVCDLRLRGLLRGAPKADDETQCRFRMTAKGAQAMAASRRRKQLATPDQGAVIRDPDTVTHDTAVVTHDTNTVTRDTAAVIRDTDMVTRDTAAVIRDTNTVTRDPNLATDRQNDAVDGQDEISQPAPSQSRASDPLAARAAALDSQAQANIEKLLRGAGVYPRLARRLAALPWVTPALTRAWLDELQRRPGVRRLAAVLTAVLRDEQAGLPPERGESASEDEGLPDDEAAAPAPGAEAPAPTPSATPPIGPHHAPWGQTVELLQQAEGGEWVERWLRPTAPLALCDDELLVWTPSAYALDWVKRQASQIAAAATQVWGRPMRVEFTVRRDWR